MNDVGKEYPEKETELDPCPDSKEEPQRVFCTWCRGTNIYHNKPCSECKDGVQELE